MNPAVMKAPSLQFKSTARNIFKHSFKQQLLFMNVKCTFFLPVLILNCVTVSEFIDSFFSLQALYASKIISYAQGFMLLRQAAKEFGWSLNYGAIALMWRGGCIIRRYI